MHMAIISSTTAGTTRRSRRDASHSGQQYARRRYRACSGRNDRTLGQRPTTHIGSRADRLQQIWQCQEKQRSSHRCRSECPGKGEARHYACEPSRPVHRWIVGQRMANSGRLFRKRLLACHTRNASEALRAVYEVPPDKGFVVGDIKINGKTIDFGPRSWTLSRSSSLGWRRGLD